MPKRVPLRGHFRDSIRVLLDYKGFGFKGPCAQIEYTLAPKYLYRDYF